MRGRKKTFTDEDIIRFFLFNLSRREQGSVRHFFRKLFQDIRRLERPKKRRPPFDCHDVIRIFEENLDILDRMCVINYMCQFCTQDEPETEKIPIEEIPDYPKLPPSTPGPLPIIPLIPPVYVPPLIQAPGVPQLPGPTITTPALPQPKPTIIPIIIPPVIPEIIDVLMDLVEPEVQAAEIEEEEEVPRETIPPPEELMPAPVQMYPQVIRGWTPSTDVEARIKEDWGMTLEEYTKWQDEMEADWALADIQSRFEYYSEHDMVHFESTIMGGHHIEHEIRHQNYDITIEIIKVDGKSPGEFLDSLDGDIEYLEILLDELYNYYETLED